MEVFSAVSIAPSLSTFKDTDTGSAWFIKSLIRLESQIDSLVASHAALY